MKCASRAFLIESRQVLSFSIGIKSRWLPENVQKLLYCGENGAVFGLLLDNSTAYALLLDNQSSYRQGHSTETALVKVHSYILMNMGKQKVNLLVLLYLCAAFDAIDHKTLLEISKTDFRVVSNAKKWISSFFSCRTQCVFVNENCSKSFDIDCSAR